MREGVWNTKIRFMEIKTFEMRILKKSMYNSPEIDALIAQVESLNNQVTQLSEDATAWRNIEDNGLFVYDHDLGMDRKVFIVHESGDERVGVKPFIYFELDSIHDD